MLCKPGLVGINYRSKSRPGHSLTVIVDHSRHIIGCGTTLKHLIYLYVISHRILQSDSLKHLKRQLSLRLCILKILCCGTKINSHLDTGSLSALNINIGIRIHSSTVSDTDHNKVKTVSLSRLPVNVSVHILELGNLGTLLNIHKC